MCAGPQGDAPSPRASALPPAALLALALVLSKAFLLPRPEGPGFFLDLAAASCEDVLIAAGAGLLLAAGLRATQRRPRVARALFAAFIALAAISIAWSVVNVKVYEVFARPVNLQMSGLVGKAGNLRSSVAERATLPAVAALFLAPALYVALALRARARMRPTPWRSAAALAVALAWISAGAIRLGASAGDSTAAAAAPNPVRVFLASAIDQCLGQRLRIPPADFPPEFLRDFEPPRPRPARPFPGPAPRNVILVVLESVGTRYLSLYGSPYDTTPSLRAEAGSSLVFDRFYAHTGYTYCELMSLLFGCYPGLPWCMRPQGDRPMPGGLGAKLAARGLRTGYFHSGDLDWDSARWSVHEAGFEDALGHEDLGCPDLSSWGTEDRCLFDALLAWIDRDRARPFFAMCWTDQTHDPYVPSPGERFLDFVADEKLPHARALDRYLNVVRTADAQLGRLFRALRERGLASETLVVVTGDHGEAFGVPHGQVGHGSGLYEEEVQVPLVLWSPALFSPGRRTAALGAHADIVPTIADVLGVEPDRGWQGASLFAPERPPRVYFMLGWDICELGVRDERWKYLFSASRGVERLYDLESDPEESHDVSAREPASRKELRGRVSAFIAAESDYLAGSGR